MSGPTDETPDATPDEPLEAFGEILVRMSDRITELEDTLAEAVEGLAKELSRIRHKLDTIEDVVAKKKHVKRIAKVLEQLEIVDEDRGDDEDERD